MKDLKSVMQQLGYSSAIENLNEAFVNVQIDYAISVLKQLINPIKSYNLTTEEYNDILFKKIEELKKEKI